MEYEVFIPENGDMFYVAQVRFTELERRPESRPCKYFVRNGVYRDGTMYYTLESGKVSFSARPGSIRIGERGQLSSTNDQFFDVTILSVEPHGDRILVCGEAKRAFDEKRDR